MNVSEAVRARRSIRAFLPDPVPSDRLRRIVEQAAWSPSNSNIQPWHVKLIAGTRLAALKQAMTERQGCAPPRDPFQFPIYPETLAASYAERRGACAERQYSAAGIAREDHEARWQYVLGNLQAFGAPAAMFCFVEQGMGPSQWADLGCYIQSLMLLLTEAGIDSCAQISWCIYNETIRGFFKVPDGWVLYCGISIGYRDPRGAGQCNRAGPRAAPRIRGIPARLAG